MPSVLLGPRLYPLIYVSRPPKAFIWELGVDNIMGPLLFLKIEGGKHFFPSSKSFSSYSLCLFFVSLSLGSPFLYEPSNNLTNTVVCLRSAAVEQLNAIAFYAVSLSTSINCLQSERSFTQVNIQVLLCCRIFSQMFQGLYQFTLCSQDC